MSSDHGTSNHLKSQNIRDSACFTIMDEYTDISNKEQFTIRFRWVGDDLQDYEDFIGLYEVDSIDANFLVHAVKDTLIVVANVMMGRLT